jgi:hypothetical protein
VDEIAPAQDEAAAGIINKGLHRHHNHHQWDDNHNALGFDVVLKTAFAATITTTASILTTTVTTSKAATAAKAGSTDSVFGISGEVKWLECQESGKLD